jgi:hypothetical protein
MAVAGDPKCELVSLFSVLALFDADGHRQRKDGRKEMLTGIYLIPAIFLRLVIDLATS